MIKKLSKIGNSFGIVIERPILELLKIDDATLLEISTDGNVLTIRPLRESKAKRVRASAEKLSKTHATVLKKLAQ